MTCRRCNAETKEGGKFCTSCGAPLGTVCDRCGNLNEVEDSFCGMCGMALVGSLPIEKGVSRDLQATITTPGNKRQYTAGEIDELLSLRRALRTEERSAQGLKQDDIDQLFE